MFNNTLKTLFPPSCLNRTGRVSAAEIHCRMAQTNLIIKVMTVMAIMRMILMMMMMMMMMMVVQVVLCLVLPAYHTLQHANMSGPGSSNTLAIFR